MRTGHGLNRLAITNLHVGNKTDVQANLSNMKYTVNRTLCYWKCGCRQLEFSSAVLHVKDVDLMPIVDIHFRCYEAGYESVKEADL